MKLSPNLKLKTKKQWAIASGALVTLLLITQSASASLKSFFTFGNTERLGTVKRSTIAQKVSVAGNILPNRRTTITAPYNAYVHKIYVKVGQIVTQGTPLVSLVQSLSELREPVYPLRAPFAGTVVQIPRSEGEYVDSNSQDKTIIRIDDLSKLFIASEVPESNVSQLKIGMEVLMRPNSGATRDYPGVIREISLAAKDKQGGWGRPGDRVSFDVRMEILEWDDFVKPGMSAIVDIITQKRDQVLSLPHEFVEHASDGSYYVTGSDGKKKKVEVGLSNEEVFEIISGVKENEPVKLVNYYSAGQGPDSSPN